MTTLLIIDCQKDFHPGGSLAIPSANDDAERIASLIREHGHRINRIIATLDSHNRLHVAHPTFWTDPSTGDRPPPFTIISSEDVEGGRWVPRGDVRFFGTGGRPSPPKFADDEVEDEDDDDCGDGAPSAGGGEFDVARYCAGYARRLESGGRFRLCVWPEHCLIGSAGHDVVDVVMGAMNAWSDETGGIVEWRRKGTNPWTEMYSALRAEVPVGGGTGFDA